MLKKAPKLLSALELRAQQSPSNRRNQSSAEFQIDSLGAAGYMRVGGRRTCESGRVQACQSAPPVKDGARRICSRERMAHVGVQRMHRHL